MEGTVRSLFFALTCLRATIAAPLSDNVSSIAVISPSIASHASVVANLTTTPPMDADISPPTFGLGENPLTAACPKKLKICWQDNPPYFIKRNLTGVFKDVIQDVLKTCCDSDVALPQLDFLREAGDDEGLRNCTDDFNLTLPMRSTKLPSGGRPGTFIKVVQSPGIALVLNREKLVKDAQENVWNEILQIWTVLALALLLAAIFGIVVWALDNMTNPSNFPPQFHRGAPEGIWWAFVTMTTVGYGDRTPKGILARVFATVWMFVGISLVSLVTATMTSALTSGKVGNPADVFNKKIGVLDGAQGYEEGIKQGADVRKYGTLADLYRGLVDENLDGIMLDVFKASYSANHLEMDGNLIMAKIFEYPFILGFHVSSAGLEQWLVSCIDETSSKLFQSEVYHAVRRYVQGAALKGMDREASSSKSGSWQTKLNTFSTDGEFYRYLMVLGSVLGGLMLLGFIYEALRWRRSKTLTLNKSRGSSEAHKLRTSSQEFQTMMDNLNELEKSLAKISEFKELYHKLKIDMEHQDSDKKKLRVATKAHTCPEHNSYTNIRLENFRSR